MRDFSAEQQAALATGSLEARWLFDVTRTDGAVFRWSAAACAFGGADYENAIIADRFSGIKLNRAKSELNVQTPDMVTFSVSNPDGAYSASGFEGASVLARIVSGALELAAWAFEAIRCESVYRRLDFTCKDVVYARLEGYYPNTALVASINATTASTQDDSYCVPLPFGTAYIPLRTVYVAADAKRYYLLGPSQYTYTIDRVRSPRAWSSTSEWIAPTLNFYDRTLNDGLEYTLFEPIIADSDGDGVMDSVGLWYDNGAFLDMPTRFTRSDTAAMTNPAAIIAYALKDMGVAEVDIDAASFAEAAATFDVWGLAWNGALFYKEDRSTSLARLLNMCHATLRTTDKVELHVLSAEPRLTVTAADVYKASAAGEGSFSYSPITTKQSDSGYAAFQTADEPQDEFVSILVSAGDSTSEKSSETLNVPWVQDATAVQRLGILYFQRLLLQKANISFTALPQILAVQPDDVVTVSGGLYGGEYTVLVDAVTINRNLTIGIDAIRFKSDLQDWEDLSPGDVSYASEEVTNVWQPVVSGPDASATLGRTPNVVAGRLRVGAESRYIIIDPYVPAIGLYDSGALEIYIDANARQIRSGNYVSGVAGRGFLLSPDLAEAGNLSVRGLIRAAVFQKDVVSAVGGNLLIRPADVLDADMTTADDCALTVKGSETFAVGDVLRIKDGLGDEWLVVLSVASAPTYTVARDRAGAYGANTKPGWLKGASVVNYGPAGSGGVYLSSSEVNAPHITVYDHAGTPWTGVDARVRIGNLNGFLGYSEDRFGIGIGDSEHYLKYDPEGGLEIRGKVFITGGSVGDDDYSFTEVFDADLETILANWEMAYGSTETDRVLGGVSGGHALRVGNGSGNDDALLLGIAVPYNTLKLYHIQCRIRRASGAGTCNIGVAGVAADRTTLVNTAGAASYESQHYVVASGAAPGSDWTLYEGYMMGSALTGTGSPCPSTDAPGKLHADARYVRPLIEVNRTDQPGVFEIDEFSMDLIEPVPWNLVTSTPEELTDGRVAAGLDALGFIRQYVSGPALPSATPSEAGLHLTKDYLGYWSGSAWNAFIDKNGLFQFYGADDKRIVWDGANLDVRGRLVADDIVSGTLDANRIGAGTITSGHLTTTTAVITETAQIKDAIVDTLKLAGNAVTVPTGVDMTWTHQCNGAWQTLLQSTWFDPLGGTYVFTVHAIVRRTYPTGSALYFKIYDVFGTVYDGAALGCNILPDSGYEYRVFSFTRHRPYGSGTQVVVQVLGTNEYVEVVNASISIMGARR